MRNRFEGKVAVVTGAGGGVGRGVAMLLAQHGASVVVNDLGCGVGGLGSSHGPADSVVEEITANGGNAIASYDDVTVMEEARNVVGTALETFGGLDVLVNSVAVRIDRPIGEMSPQEFDRVVRSCVKGTFAPTRYAAAHFRRQRSGRIVNMTSDAGLGASGCSSYAAASEAIVGMTRTIARDLGKYGVTCNAIAPDVETRLSPGPPGDFGATEESDVTWPDAGQWDGPGAPDDPDNVAPLALFLCTGSVPDVNGYVFGVRRGDIYLFSNPSIDRSVHKWGAFTMEEMDGLAPGVLGAGSSEFTEARIHMPERFDGRVAIVTGGGRGIGRSVALLLASEGASVVVNDLGTAVDGAATTETPADQVVKEIEDAGGRALASHDSVAEFDAARNIVQRAIDAFGRVDILCNAAGILRDRMVFNMSEEEFDGVLRVHLYGAFNLVRNCAPHMIRQRYGRIVLFASSSGLGAAGQANYASAKEGMVGFARSLAVELAPHGISVNAVYPGALTRMVANVPEATRRLLRQQARAAPGPQVGPAEILASAEPDEAMTPESNAPKIAFLVSERGGSVTGQVVGTAGWSMSRYSRRRVTRSIHKKGRWTLEELERLMPISLAAGLVNPAPAEPQKQRPA